MTYRRGGFRPALLLLFVAFPALVMACSSKGGGGASAKGPVAATVNGEKITVAEVDKLVKIINQGIAQGRVTIPDTTKGASPDEKARNYALSQLIERTLIMGDAKKQGVTIDTMQVNQTLAQYKQSMIPPDSVVTPEAEAEIRQDLSDYLLINKYFQESVVAKIAPPTEEEMKDYMAKNPDYFGPHEQVSASHILILVPDKSTEMARADSLKKAQSILAMAKKGEDFAGLARKYSQDPGSKGQGGQLPPFGRGAMVKEFEDAAFSLEPGQISDLVQTAYGYHIIKVQNKGMSPPVTFEQARPQLEQVLQKQKADQAVQKKIDELRAAAKIEIKEQKG